MISFKPPFTHKQQDEIGSDNVINDMRIYEVFGFGFTVKCRYQYPLPTKLNTKHGKINNGFFVSIKCGSVFPRDYRIYSSKNDIDLISYRELT